jgi:hypothetical protein
VRCVATNLRMKHSLVMGNATTKNIWGTKVVSLADAVIAYCDADDTGKMLIEATGVAAQTVEAKYAGPSTEADAGWDF